MPAARVSRPRTVEHAFSLVEVLVGMVLFTILFLPAYTLLVQSRDTTFKSRLSYFAVQAAREEIEDLRLLSRVKAAEIERFGHDWQPVKGNALDRLKPLAAPGQALAVESLRYPDEYGHIFTRVEIGESKNKLIFPAVLHVRWQEHGETFRAGAEREKQGFSRFDFFLVRARRGV